MSLNPRQMAFLAFHGHGIAPHRWEWLDATGAVVEGPPPWDRLRAVKRVGAGLKGIVITAEELAGLGPYWDAPLLQVSAEGMALLAEHTEEA